MRNILLALFTAVSIAGMGQSGESVQFKIEKAHDYIPLEDTTTIPAVMYSIEAPTPGGTSYKSFLGTQKVKQQNNPNLGTATQLAYKTENPTPVAGFGTPLFRTLPNGMAANLSDGIPNDNAMAANAVGQVVAGVNSFFWAVNTADTSLVFPNGGLRSLKAVAGGSTFENYYDPKLTYDPVHKRFVLVFLKDNTAATSKIIVAFSSTDNPLDPWHVYRLPGNPLNNNRWTDFPAVALSDSGVVITANLIIPNVSWQVGFDGSLIWHIDKFSGYNGDATLKATLYPQIKYNGTFTRNLHAVRGHDNIIDEHTFLSNRNFDLTNDTLFLVRLVESAADTQVVVTPVLASTPYGVPPNGKQADTDLTDPTKGLQTNDARVLGAIKKDNWIQFVSTTAHTGGTAAIYHGFIDMDHPSEARTQIIAHPTRDMAYPNISWTGKTEDQIQSLVGFNYTSVTDNPGVGAMLIGNDTLPSSFVDLKTGTDYVDRHSDSYERWGDYFAVQPEFNLDGTIKGQSAWMAGYFGANGNKNQTWITQVFSMDTVMPFHQDGGRTFPNPVMDNNVVTVEFNLEQDQRVLASLYNERGQLVQHLTGRDLNRGANAITLDLGTLRNGVYILVLQGDKGFEKKERLVKI